MPEVKTIQIINIKIDADKLDTKYYNLKSGEIRKKINGKPDTLLINFILKKPITKKWIVETLLHLQKGFTDTLIIPKNNIKESELLEWISFFRPQKILKQGG